MASLAAVCVGSPTAAHAGWWDDAGAARPVSFEEARTPPEGLAGLIVTFRARVRPVETSSVLARGLRRGAWPRLEVLPVEGEAEPVELVVRPRTAAALRAAGVAEGTLCILHATVHVQRGRRSLELKRLTRPADPPTPEESARARRADRFLDSGNPLPAREIYEGLLAEREHDAAFRLRLHRRMARASVDALDHDGAVAAFERLLEDHPGDREAQRMLASLAERRIRPAGRVGTAPPPAPDGLDIPLPPAPSLAGPDGLPLLPEESPQPGETPPPVTPPLPDEADVPPAPPAADPK